MKWHIKIFTDVVRGNWNEQLATWTYWETFFLIASSGKFVYAHFKEFEQWDDANKLYEKVIAVQEFSPENKVGIWLKICDLQPSSVRKRDTRWWYFTKR